MFKTVKDNKKLEELEELEEDLKDLEEEGKCSCCGDDCECDDECDCDDSEMDLAIISTKVDAILELLLEKKVITEAEFEKKYDELCEREE